MKTQVQLKALVAGKSEKKSQDGTKDYYSLAIVQDGEAGSVSCNQETFMAVEPMNQYVLYAQINEYQGKLSFRIIGVLQPTTSTPKVDK